MVYVYLPPVYVDSSSREGARVDAAEQVLAHWLLPLTPGGL